MNLLEVEKGLSDGSITLDSKGHSCNPVLESIQDTILNKKEFLEKLKTDKDEMISFITAQLTHDFLPGQLIGEREHYCFDCGETLHLTAIDEKTVALVNWSLWSGAREKAKKGYDFCMNTNEIPNCSCKEARELGKLVAEINVPSGELLFKNFFKKKELYGIPRSFGYHSINAINGRNELMQYLATQNIGYGQMGNMSVSVFVNTNGDEIIIGDNYGYNRETDKEFTITHDGFESYGTISLDVWRWMCGDLQILREHNEEITENLKVTEKNDNYQDEILTNVQPGTWVIEHYYDFCDDNSTIYSKLYLKK